MKRKMQMLLLTLTMIFLCGCGGKEIVTISASGKITNEVYGYGSPKDVKKDGSIKMEKIKGKKYYVFKGEKSLADGLYMATYYKKDGTEVTEGISSQIDPQYNHDFVLTPNMFLDYCDSNIKSYEDFNLLQITFPKKIKYTNGKLSKDKKTVTFDYNNFKKGDKIYAYTSKADALSANVGPIKLSGLNNAGHIRKAKTLKVKTKEKIKYIKVNGKKQKSTKIKIKKEGKYEIVVKTKKNKATFHVCYDKTKPVVKVEDVGNGQKRITFSDENSGIKYAKGPFGRIESGHITPIAGAEGYWEYEIYDNAGNVNKVQVKVAPPVENY